MPGMVLDIEFVDGHVGAKAGGATGSGGTSGHGRLTAKSGLDDKQGRLL